MRSIIKRMIVLCVLTGLRFSVSPLYRNKRLFQCGAGIAIGNSLRAAFLSQPFVHKKNPGAHKRQGRQRIGSPQIIAQKQGR